MAVSLVGRTVKLNPEKGYTKKSCEVEYEIVQASFFQIMVKRKNPTTEKEKGSIMTKYKDQFVYM